MSEKPDAAALDLAWALYIDTVQTAMREQYADVHKGRPARPILCAPPTVERVEMIAKALNQAEGRGVSAALGPVVDLCDEMDNAKRGMVNRARVQRIYDDLHKLKAEREQ